MSEMEQQLECLRCGYECAVTVNSRQGLQERVCTTCKSNSVRKVPSKKQ